MVVSCSFISVPLSPDKAKDKHNNFNIPAVHLKNHPLPVFSHVPVKGLKTPAGDDYNLMMANYWVPNPCVSVYGSVLK
jgi:hypothetical protein